MPAQVIGKGIPTAGLPAQIMVAKFADHLPLYRQEKIFARTTLAQWVGAYGIQLQPQVDVFRDDLPRQDVILADETPVQMLAPGTYAPSTFADLKAVVYDFRPRRAGEHARGFLGDWQGKLICYDLAGY